VQPGTEAVASFIAGFVAAEATFRVTDTIFTFAVGLGASDAGMCEALVDFFGVGRITHSPRRETHYDDEVAFAVRSTRALVEVIVPFMDEHLTASYKRTQYEAWRARLLDHWEHTAKRVRPCMLEGCDTPRRAHGLCRHHLYRQRRE
jgi:hypothetical protein